MKTRNNPGKVEKNELLLLKDGGQCNRFPVPTLTLVGRREDGNHTVLPAPRPLHPIIEFT